MSTIKIKTQNGYEKVEIPSCLPANVEFGEPEDWTSRWNTSFVADCDGILCLYGSKGNTSGTLWCRDNGDTVLAQIIQQGHSGSVTLSIKKGRTYSIENTSGLTFSEKGATLYPFKTVPVNDYSTDEICIGKWIDGKPLYRKVFKGNLPSSAIITDSRYRLNVALASGIESIITAKGFVIGSGGYKETIFNTIMSTDGGIALCSRAYIDNSNNLCFNIDLYSNYAPNFINRPYEITVEYTKQ